MDKLTNAIIELALDTENAEKNYNLGLLYEEIGQTASAINYFYRAAERTLNKELIYECLCKTALCYERQGNRKHTVRRVLQHALYVRPKRPEAYFLITRLLERNREYVDGYTYASIALQICDFDTAPLRSDVEYPGMYALLFEKAVCAWWWGKNNESRKLLLELNDKYKDDMLDIYKTAVENNIKNIFGPSDNKSPVNTSTKEKKRTIIDFFSYHDDTSKELLQLRVNLLKDHVDYFVISELNRTHSGSPIDFKLKERIKEYGLPEDKIIPIQLDISDESKIIPTDIDYNNSGVNRDNINSVKARVRERLQKDSILNVLDAFDDDTIIIHSDCDEIIDPKAINFVCEMAAQTYKSIIKVPLVWLEGKADLRVYDKNTNSPAKWDRSMFVCTKRQIVASTPTAIRSGYSQFPIVWCTHDGKIAEDLGWHFSWMGGKEKRNIKRGAFIHHDDKYEFLKGNGYNTEESIQIIEEDPKEGSTPPSLESNNILKQYDISGLPKILFQIEDVRKYMFLE